MFTILITAIVPVICEIRTEQLFCNAPYRLYIESLDGVREIERGGPAIRDLPPLPDGQRYTVSVQ